MLLKLEALTVSYGERPVLEGAELSMQAGEVVSILGANGAGKSTLLKCILGLTEKQTRVAGRVLIESQPLNNASLAARAHIAYVPEQPAVYGHLSGRDNLRYFLSLTKHPPRQARIEESLTQVGLPKAAWDNPCHTYSKGMRQKVMLALAVARQAKLLLLDEPNSGLDPNATEELNQLIKDCKSLGMGVLVVTHDVLSALGFSDTLYMLAEGRLQPIHLDRDALSFETLKALY